jgi:hypothetical protein
MNIKPLSVAKKATALCPPLGNKHKDDVWRVGRLEYIDAPIDTSCNIERFRSLIGPRRLRTNGPTIRAWGSSN